MCKLDKALDDFYRDKRTTDGRYPYCKDCWKKYSRNRKRNDPATRASTKKCNSRYYKKPEVKERMKQYYKRRGKAISIKRKYGLSLEAYNLLLLEQQNVCAICKMEVGLCVDHDHTTGKVRGLLCRECNTGLGRFKDKKELLLEAINYLDKGTIQAPNNQLLIASLNMRSNSSVE